MEGTSNLKFSARCISNLINIQHIISNHLFREIGHSHYLDLTFATIERNLFKNMKKNIYLYKNDSFI